LDIAKAIKKPLCKQVVPGMTAEKVAANDALARDPLGDK